MPDQRQELSFEGQEGFARSSLELDGAIEFLMA